MTYALTKHLVQCTYYEHMNVVAVCVFEVDSAMFVLVQGPLLLPPDLVAKEGG